LDAHPKLKIEIKQSSPLSQDFENKPAASDSSSMRAYNGVSPIPSGEPKVGLDSLSDTFRVNAESARQRGNRSRGRGTVESISEISASETSSFGGTTARDAPFSDISIPEKRVVSLLSPISDASGASQRSSLNWAALQPMVPISSYSSSAKSIVSSSNPPTSKETELAPNPVSTEPHAVAVALQSPILWSPIDGDAGCA
jgi:hypothetical protein